jgi:hypothetical protein
MDKLFKVFHKPTGKHFGDPGFWDRNDEKHLEDHLFIGPTGRVFWSQFDGLKEITNDCELTFTPPAI